MSRNTILVAYPLTRDQALYPGYTQDLVNFFQSKFQTYGRTVTLYPYNVSNGEGPATTAQMVQDASTVNAAHPFADMGYKFDNNGQSFTFYDALKSDGIVSMEQSYTDPLAVPQAHLTRMAPFEWTYSPPEDEVLANTGDFVCQSLQLGSGHNATFAASPLNNQPRTVGVARVVDATAPNTAVDPSPLVSRLQGCGGLDGNGAFNLNADGTNNVNTFDCTPALRQFIKDGVTTVAVLGQESYFGACMNQANTLKYLPEWVAQDVYEQDNDQATYYDQEPAGTLNEATGHLIGVQSFNKSLPVSARYSQQAGQAFDAAYREPIYPDQYYNLMMLFTGIQYAGPNLTPDSFQAGMFKAGYPDPGADAAPSYQAQVGGWGPTKHSEVNDFAPVWFSPTNPAPDGSLPYGWCYVDRGVRYSGSRWPPLTSKLFQGACH